MVAGVSPLPRRASPRAFRLGVPKSPGWWGGSEPPHPPAVAAYATPSVASLSLSLCFLLLTVVVKKLGPLTQQRHLWSCTTRNRSRRRWRRRRRPRCPLWRRCPGHQGCPGPLGLLVQMQVLVDVVIGEAGAVRAKQVDGGSDTAPGWGAYSW